MSDSKYSVITVRGERELMDKFRSICKEQGVNQTGILRKFIKDFVKKNEEEDE